MLSAMMCHGGAAKKRSCKGGDRQTRIGYVTPGRKGVLTHLTVGDLKKKSGAWTKKRGAGPWGQNIIHDKIKWSDDAM
jgi:hypothetical protein